ncbi:type IV secretion protein Rhs [Flavobacteriaceae bacterium CRH]|nr:type IV secretion protein Rhs [Flavobacteriaceae bacterium CRH]
MANFSEQVHITIEDFTQTVIYYDLELSQKMMDHHFFSFVWQYTGKAIIKPEDQAAALRKYKGREVIFTFKSLTGIRLMSKGIICGLQSVDVNGSPVGLHIKGISHTILLDDMPKSRTFLDRNLKEIALKVFSEETAGEFYHRDAIEPIYSKIFDYKPQYNETSFDFLKRLSARYGEWFYFDGMRIQFGRTKVSKLKLINGASMHRFGIETNLVSHKTSFAGYDYDNAKKISSGQAKTNIGSTDSFSRVVLDRQASVCQEDVSVTAYTNQAKNAAEITEMVKLQTAGRDANSVFYTGISYFPIGLGQVFTIQNQNVEHELIAIEVIHRSEVHGNYSCDFKAIPADVAAPHYTDVRAFGKAESQSAVVFDNNDPEGLGRIKVEFNWGAGSTKSDWMRVTQQYSGEGRGMYWRPEKGDEVLVDFEGGNIDCPYVSGSHYNGRAKPDFFDAKNDLKGMENRSGQHLLFEEFKNITLADKKGNKIHIDSTGDTLNFTALNTINFNAQNININAEQNMTTTVGFNKTNTVGGDYTETITGSKYLTIGINFILSITGKMSEWIKGSKETESKGIKEMAKEINLSSNEENINMFGAKNINNHSGETSKNG